jgi:hypothetical protein
MNKEKMEIRYWLNQNMFWCKVAHYHYLLTCYITQNEEKKVIHLLFPLWWLYKYWNILECDAVHIRALCFILCLGLLTQTSRIEFYVLSCILAQTFVLSNNGMCFPCPQISTLPENCTLLGYYTAQFSSASQRMPEITHRTFLVCKLGGLVVCVCTGRCLVTVPVPVGLQF